MGLDAADMLVVLNLWELLVKTVENRRMPVEEAKEINQNGLMVKWPSRCFLSSLHLQTCVVSDEIGCYSSYI